MPESTLNRQFMSRSRDKTANEMVQALADYSSELGVPIVLDMRNYQVLLDFVLDGNARKNDLFGALRAKIDRMRELAVTYNKLTSNPFAALIDGESGLDAALEIHRLDKLGILLLSILTSEDACIRSAFEAAKGGDFDALRTQLLEISGVNVQIFGGDAPELEELAAINNAVKYHNPYPLAMLLNPDDQEAAETLAGYYVSLPGTTERKTIDAAISACVFGDIRALKELLAEKDYTICHKPSSKKPKASSEA